MVSIDLAVVLIISSLAARGVWTGFVRQVAFIAALILAFVVAGRFYPYFAIIFRPLVSTPQLNFLLTYSLLFVLVYLGVMLAGLGMKKVMKVSMLGGFDRLMGGIFGMGKGVFIATLLFMIIAGTLSNSATFLRKSYFYPFFDNSSRMVTSFISDRDLRSRFSPSEPAISALYDEELGLPGYRRREITEDQRRALDEIRYQLAREVGDRPRR